MAVLFLLDVHSDVATLLAIKPIGLILRNIFRYHRDKFIMVKPVIGFIFGISFFLSSYKESPKRMLLKVAFCKR